MSSRDPRLVYKVSDKFESDSLQDFVKRNSYSRYQLSRDVHCRRTKWKHHVARIRTYRNKDREKILEKKNKFSDYRVDISLVNWSPFIRVRKR